jgi:hypothetical protein
MNTQTIEQTDDLPALDAIAPLPLSVIESQERANIDMLISTAKKYPRDLQRVKRNMEAMATMDEETAEACNYRLIRDGHSIEGPGVRLAEIAVTSYQNIRAGSRVLSNDGKVITGQAFCHDLENNTFIAWETQRRITDKKGRVYSEDMQVTTGNAAAAIAFRNAVFKVIPGALIRSVADKARAVAVGDLKTLTERRSRALKRFASIGVREDQILAFLGRANAEQIDIADVEKLFGVFTAIKDQSTTIEEQFPPIAKVVEPNFSHGITREPSSPPTAAYPIMPEPPKRRGRPPKNPGERNLEFPVTAAAMAPVEQSQAEQKAAADPLLAIIKEWLEADKLDWSEFVAVMVQNGFAKPGAKLEDVDPEGFEVALKQREQITKHLREVANDQVP